MIKKGIISRIRKMKKILNNLNENNNIKILIYLIIEKKFTLTLFIFHKAIYYV